MQRRRLERKFLPNSQRQKRLRKQSLMHAVAEKRVTAPATAWHCCLEFFSVATRLPPEYRLSPADAARLLQEEVFPRMAVHDLPAGEVKFFFTPPTDIGYEVHPPQAISSIHCFGHIHDAYGKEERGSTTFINAANLDEQYQPANPPVVIDF